MESEEFGSIEDLMVEVDVNVKRLSEVFRFILKYQILAQAGGMEFAGLREYAPGMDDATKIDWKASLRAKKLYVKEYEDERDLDVYILLDTSASMIFGTGEKLKSEYAAVVAATIANSAIDSGDNVGFSMFNDEIVYTIPPSNDSITYYRILKSVTNPKYYGGGCNLEGALTTLVNTVQDKTMLFIISDYVGVGPTWDNALKMLSGKLTKIFGIMVRDERDSYIPEGIGYIRLSDSQSNKYVTINLDAVRDRYNQLAAEQEEDYSRKFHQSRSLLIKVYTKEPFIGPLVKYLEMGV